MNTELYTWEKPREIIIMAMGPSRGMCPFDAETWALNMGYLQIAAVGPETQGELNGRIDKIFMVHKQVYTAEGKPYFAWQDYNKMADAGVEMWNIHDVNCETCGKSLPFKKYPLDEIIEKFDLGYFSDTICYMLAYALHICTDGNKKDHTLKLKYPLKIRLYGVDLQDKEEYGEEKGGVECWLGYALGLGADFTIANGSTLLLTSTGRPYGFDPVDYSYLDPYSVLNDSGTLSENEYKERFDEVMDTIMKMTRNVYPQSQNYSGEGAKGLHRIPIDEAGYNPAIEIPDDTTS